MTMNFYVSTITIYSIGYVYMTYYVVLICTGILEVALWNVGRMDLRFIIVSLHKFTDEYRLGGLLSIHINPKFIINLQ